MKADLKKPLTIAFLVLLTFALLNVAMVLLFYFWGAPKIVESKCFASRMNYIVKKALDLDLKIENPKLKTSLKTIDFKVDNLSLYKGNEAIVELLDFDTSVGLSKIFQNELKLNRLKAKKLIVLADKLQESIPESEESTDFDNFYWKIDYFNSDIALDEMEVSYKQKNGSLCDISLRDIFIDYENEYKNLGFNMLITLSKNNKTYAEIVASTVDEIKIYDNYMTVDNLKVLINESDLLLNAKADIKKADISAVSRKFYLSDIFNLINCDFIIQNGSAMLKPLTNPKGNVNFNISANNITVNKMDLSGTVNINNTKAELRDVTNLPLNISKGKIKISKDKVEFVDLVGYYGKNKNNKLTIIGSIKDYFKTFDSMIQIDTYINNEFLKDYLAPVIQNTVLKIEKPAQTRIIYKAKNNIMDIVWLAKIDKGVHFGVDDNRGEISNYIRALKGEFHIEGNNLDIKNINYYIIPEYKAGVKSRPVFVLDAKMKLDGTLSQAGFSFDHEINSEIINIFLKQELFKGGTVKGSAHVNFKNNVPILDGSMTLNQVRVPSQRLFIKEGSFTTDSKYIYINAKGGYKRARINLNAKVKNELQTPIVIDKLNLNVDKIDIQRFLASVNNENGEAEAQNTKKAMEEGDIADDNYMFDASLIRIKDAILKVENGNYKEMTFGNVEANMSLDEKSILRLKSNRFDIAGGHSSLRSECDLKNLKYHIHLGTKDVDSNLMAKVLFNLDKEITGLASGIIDLDSDSTLKMNGSVKFIVKEGTIGKIGLVEYILKVASLFRNPIVMVNPAIVMDIISIPEGKFDKITGTMEIKSNIVRKIDIKSYSDTLSALVRGRFDMEAHDASLRIYTRFSANKKSMFNFLRNISLNTLANKVQMNSKNDANYYEAELAELPQIEVDEAKTQVFLTTVEGDVENNNFLSSLKKLK